jgi:BirA family biotin operon repressor/biotin-[acetyl-CoA-carboxylase] ligase
VIAGIGVNLNLPLAALPRDLRAKATSLRAVTGRRVDRARFTGGLLAALEARYGRFLSAGFPTVRAEWETFSCLTGTEVRIASAEGELAGCVLGLDADGALRLRQADGRVVRVIAGEVTVRDGYRS